MAERELEEIAYALRSMAREAYREYLDMEDSNKARPSMRRICDGLKALYERVASADKGVTDSERLDVLLRIVEEYVKESAGIQGWHSNGDLLAWEDTELERIVDDPRRALDAEVMSRRRMAKRSDELKEKMRGEGSQKANGFVVE